MNIPYSLCHYVRRRLRLVNAYLEKIISCSTISTPIKKPGESLDHFIDSSLIQIAICPKRALSSLSVLLEIHFFLQKTKIVFRSVFREEARKKKNENDKMEAKDIVSFIQWYQFYDRSFERLLPESDLMEHLNCRIFC